MITKRPQIIERGGKPAFAVLPIEDYEALQRRLEDLEDIALLREAERESRNSPGRPLAAVLKELGLASSPAKRRRTPPPRRRRKTA